MKLFGKKHNSTLEAEISSKSNNICILLQAFLEWKNKNQPIPLGLSIGRNSVQHCIEQTHEILKLINTEQKVLKEHARVSEIRNNLDMQIVILLDFNNEISEIIERIKQKLSKSDLEKIRAFEKQFLNKTREINETYKVLQPLLMGFAKQKRVA